MCLAVPGRVVDIRNERGTRMATVDFAGITKDVCLAYVPEAEIGDYAIVHVGFAISKVDEASALETLALFEEIGALDELAEEAEEVGRVGGVGGVGGAGEVGGAGRVGGAGGLGG